MFLHGDSEDSDQTGRMPRLIRVFAGRTYHFVGFVMRRLKYTLNLLNCDLSSKFNHHKKSGSQCSVMVHVTDKV